MPIKAFASRPSQSHNILFHKRNKVSHASAIPVLTKIRPGRWLHIQHLNTDPSTRTQSGRTAINGDHAKLNNGKDWMHYCTSGIKQDNVTLTDIDTTEHHAHDSLEESGEAASSRSSSAVGLLKSQPLKSQSPKSETLQLRSDSTQSGSAENLLQSPSHCSSLIVRAAGLSTGDPVPSGSQSLSSPLDHDGGPVLFFIHGVGGSSSLWYYQMRYFQNQGFEVVAPDLFGHGFSEAPRMESLYSFYELAEDSLAVFDRFCKKRNILIGHSYGSSFCTVIARERERRVTKMILISGGGPIALKPPSCHIFSLPTCLLACLKPLLTGAFVRQAFHKPRVTPESSDFSAFNVPSHVLRGTMRGQRWPDGGQDYHADINVSVLLIFGLQDEFVSLEETEWMRETIFASSLETVNAGHMVMLECPEEVNHLIHQFILKDMVFRPRAVADRVPNPGLPTPNTARRKTMPHLMPGGLS